nr:PREDICTED: protein Z-dependent protease inhibitor [Latimeria chalumnae]|eukprot:XP_014352685.1 PREDICTED: protein Z-dependent protease inhibitor [Latimeria chalumnae]
MRAALLFLLMLAVLVGLRMSPAAAGGKGHFMEKNNFGSKSIHQQTKDHLLQKEAHLDKATFQNLTAKNSDFGFNLYRKVAGKHDKNIFFSPFCISLGFTLLSLATKGDTHDQIMKGLNLHLLEDTENEYLLPALFHKLQKNISHNEELLLQQGNALFVDESFQVKEAFLSLAKHYFDAETIDVDFQNNTNAKDLINTYVNKKTDGKIEKLFDQIDTQTSLILVNYILFKGKWLHPFNPSFTLNDTFYIDKYNTVTVPMMFMDDDILMTTDDNLNCVILKLPYRGEACMLIVVPMKDSDYGVLEDHLTTELVMTWLKNVKARYSIYYPSNGDRKVVHRAVVEVDEKGTEAAAAAASGIVAYSLPPSIKVNRPFLFMIYEEITNSLLFIGRVVNPTQL